MVPKPSARYPDDGRGVFCTCSGSSRSAVVWLDCMVKAALRLYWRYALYLGYATIAGRPADSSHKSTAGISPRLKLALQIGFGSLFCLWLAWSQLRSIRRLLTLDLAPSLRFAVVLVLAAFVLVAESNATNLTDGVDGLAAETAAIAFTRVS